MGSVDYDCDGHERSEWWLRAKRVMVVFNDTPMEEGSGVFFLTAHFVIPVSSLTSSSLWSHSLLWRKYLECSSSHYSLRHPCVLTHFVIPVFSHPWLVFSPISSLSLTSLSSHLTQVIPDYSLPSLVLPLIPYSVFSHTPTLIALTQVISHSHSHHLCYHAHSSPPVLTSLLLPLTHTSVLTLSVLTPIVIPDYSLPSLVSHSLTHPRVLSHLTSLSAHTHHLSSHTHHLTSSVTTRTLTSFSLVSPHWVISHHLCSERVSVPTSMVSYYHQVYSHTVFSLTHSPTHVIPVNTSMVSYYHQVYPLTALRELVLPLTLPWCRTTTKSSHTHTNPCAPTHSHLPCPHTLCSPHFISPHSHHQLIPTHLPHSPTHHASIASSSLPITNHYQPPPIASSHSIQFIPPLSITPNPPNRLLNPLQSQFIPIPHLDAPHRLPNNIKPIQSRRWDKPQGLAGQSQLIPSQYPLHTKSSTKDCTDNTISFNTIQIVFLYPKRIKYSYVKYILSL